MEQNEDERITSSVVDDDGPAEECNREKRVIGPEARVDGPKSERQECWRVCRCVV